MIGWPALGDTFRHKPLGQNINRIQRKESDSYRVEEDTRNAKDATDPHIERHFSEENLHYGSLKTRMDIKEWLKLSDIERLNEIKSTGNMSGDISKEHTGNNPLFETNGDKISKEEYCLPSTVMIDDFHNEQALLELEENCMIEKLIIIRAKKEKRSIKNNCREFADEINEGFDQYNLDLERGRIRVAENRIGVVSREEFEKLRNVTSGLVILKEAEISRADHIGWVINQANNCHPSHALLEGFEQIRYMRFRERALNERKLMGPGKSREMNTLYRFWSHFLRQFY